MSITVEYSFNSPLEPAELAEEIGSWLGAKLEPRPDQPAIFDWGVLGLRHQLEAPHDYENDGDLNFEDYRYQIGSTTWSSLGPSLRSIQVEILALIAFVLHESGLHIHEGMLTYDMGAVIARYEQRGGDWYDRVGDRQVVYPDHLVDLRSRI